jgi:pyruvate formate lyase activating enzyme
MKGLITSTQRFSLQDGPGIRTTIFLKGCPLKCRWCSNPEAQDPRPRVVFKEETCSGEDCRKCVDVCREGAIQTKSRTVLLDPERCSLCGECIPLCLEQTLVLIGREVSIGELTAEVLKDEVFYRRSGGGVTLSGGEPLLQGEFCVPFLKECQKHRLHTVLDTSAAVAWESIEAAAEYTDLFYVDLKHVDEAAHRTFTGRGNREILKNIRHLFQAFDPSRITIRIPFIPGFNDDEESIRSIAVFLNSLAGCRTVHLLPYHRLGEKKYRLVGLEYGMGKTRLPTPEEIRKGVENYIKLGIKTVPVI